MKVVMWAVIILMLSVLGMTYSTYVEVEEKCNNYTIYVNGRIVCVDEVDLIQGLLLYEGTIYTNFRIKGY